MKITSSIQKGYYEVEPLGVKLKEKVDALILNHKKPSWHYISRTKALQSYALKIETGRCDKFPFIEDFFACTLVVENLIEVDTAIKLIESLFVIEYRRPKRADETHKNSSSFEFDDLRLYVRLKNVEYMPEGALEHIIFELQLKTFLQHAWAIATHDLIYKSDEISWPKQRVAFQIKAILEQAEVSIMGAESLSILPALAKENTESRSLNENLKFLVNNFKEENLPKDLLRLARILEDICSVFGRSLKEIEQFLDNETKAGRGATTLDLSPYGIIIQTLINQDKSRFEDTFKTKKRFRNRIFIPGEIDLSRIKIEDDTKIVRS